MPALPTKPATTPADPAIMSRGFLDLDGQRLDIAWIEPSARAGAAPQDGAEPVLVFLHEALGSIDSWRDFPARLVAATGLRGLVYARVGHGRSPPPPTPRAPGYLDVEGMAVLPALLSALKIRHPILFGHSDGATIALIYAASTATPPHGLILEAPHIFVEDETLAGIRAAMARWDQDPHFAERLGRYHDDVVGIFTAWHRVWLHPDHRGWTIDHRLPAIITPILQIQGDDDIYGTARQLDTIAALSSAPVETLWLPGAGHVPHGTASDAVIAAACRFIQSLPAIS